MSGRSVSRTAVQPCLLHVAPCRRVRVHISRRRRDDGSSSVGAFSLRSRQDKSRWMFPVVTGKYLTFTHIIIYSLYAYTRIWNQTLHMLENHVETFDCCIAITVWMFESPQCRQPGENWSWVMWHKVCLIYWAERTVCGGSCVLLSVLLIRMCISVWTGGGYWSVWGVKGHWDDIMKHYIKLMQRLSFLSL